METEHHGFGYGYQSGPDGSRTHVRKPIHCTSTIIVGQFGFPRMQEDRHSHIVGSFMIRPYAQSLTYVVSCIVDAQVLKCRCSKSDSCH